MQAHPYKVHRSRYAPTPDLSVRSSHSPCHRCSSAKLFSFLKAAYTTGDRAMSSLIDIWTVELDRISARRRAVEPSRPAASLGRTGVQEGVHAALSEDRCSAGQAPCEDAMAWLAKEQADGPGSPSPLFVQEDLFLSILVDCFGQ
uniref:Uncharacterized protein n=1 Tax=Avena sativa TaxID=4498 RepID=A0ACD5X917_AVESA